MTNVSPQPVFLRSYCRSTKGRRCADTHTRSWRGRQMQWPRMDDYVGALLAKIDALGLSENTIVIFTSDHGSRGKNSVYEGGARCQ